MLEQKNGCACPDQGSSKQGQKANTKSRTHQKSTDGFKWHFCPFVSCSETQPQSFCSDFSKPRCRAGCRLRGLQGSHSPAWKGSQKFTNYGQISPRRMAAAPALTWRCWLSSPKSLLQRSTLKQVPRWWEENGWSRSLVSCQPETSAVPGGGLESHLLRYQLITLY